MVAQVLLCIEDTSHVGGARRAAMELAASLGFDSTLTGQAALAVTEASTNILKHAQRGRIVLRSLRRGDLRGMEVLALDRGPGMANVAASLRDGHSTAGSLGMGLGALARLSDAFEVYSRPGQGTAVRLELWARSGSLPAPSFEIGAVCLAKAGESASGDDWHCEFSGRYLALLVVDGLGHGVDAAAAAHAATRAFADNPYAPVTNILETCHVALAPTRGAAVAAARLEPDAERGTFAGVGNITARVEGERPRSLVSHNGTVGHNLRKLQEFAFPWPRNALLILHSDGLATHWSLRKYPGLSTKHPGLIAGVLYRDFERGRDDVTVVVVRNTARRQERQ